MTEFYLFRHGETDWNHLGRMQGSADIPLNARGLAQAEAVREYFDRLRGEIAFDPKRDLISSPLMRASKTARIAFRLTESDPLRFEPRFRETHMGLAEGMTRDELVGSFGEEIWNEWIGLSAKSWNARFPDGESKGEVRDRALQAMIDYSREADAYRGSSGKRHAYAVATHGGLLRRVLHHLHPHLTTPIDVLNCSVFKISYDGKNWVANCVPLFQP